MLGARCDDGLWLDAGPRLPVLCCAWLAGFNTPEEPPHAASRTAKIVTIDKVRAVSACFMTAPDMHKKLTLLLGELPRLTDPGRGKTELTHVSLRSAAPRAQSASGRASVRERRDAGLPR